MELEKLGGWRCFGQDDIKDTKALYSCCKCLEPRCVAGTAQGSKGQQGAEEEETEKQEVFRN